MAVALVLTALVSNTAVAQERTVPLPTELDAMAFAPLSQTLLFDRWTPSNAPSSAANRGIETQLPGRVTDRERVNVGLDTDGSISRVVVFQRLTLSGLGDYQFRVPGPARDVRGLPGSATNPGLRKGSVLWQGFSSGREVLAAEVDLMPNLERDRLPLAFQLAMSAGGQPLEPGQRASGPFTLDLRVSNSSEAQFGVVQADADPAALASVLDRVRKVLRRGERPVPGERGVPKAVPIRGRSTYETRNVRVPFIVRGRFVFPPGSLTNIRVTGAELKTERGDTVVAFREMLGGGAPNDLRLSISGDARDVRLPELHIKADPAVPSPQTLDPPAGDTWENGVRLQPSAFDGREMISLLMETMWEVARIRQFEAYLGNPDLRGESESTYLFRLSPRVQPPPAVAPPPPPRPGPIGIAAFALGALALLTVLGVLWSRS